MTLEEQLKSVQQAIARIEENGQEIDIEVNQNRRRISRADLRDLYQREAQLKLAITRRMGGGLVNAIPR
jgi:hypothetical protein